MTLGDIVPLFILFNQELLLLSKKTQLYRSCACMFGFYSVLLYVSAVHISHLQEGPS
jgi:hypothetical protein